MSERTHRYEARIRWSGETRGYDTYSRRHEATFPGKPGVTMSADPAFRGDADAANPEDLLVASVASCHMLWYLHLCAERGVVVTSYVDEAEGEMVEHGRGGHMRRILLRPTVTIRPGGDTELAEALHEAAHAACFIANSLKTEILVEPYVICAGSGGSDSPESGSAHKHGPVAPEVVRWPDSADEPVENALRAHLASLGYAVHRYVYPSGTHFDWHTHDVDKIDAVLAGRFEIAFEGGRVELGPGDYVVVPAGARHAATVVGDDAVVSLDAVRHP